MEETSQNPIFNSGGAFGTTDRILSSFPSQIDVYNLRTRTSLVLFGKSSPFPEQVRKQGIADVTLSNNRVIFLLSAHLQDPATGELMLQQCKVQLLDEIHIPETLVLTTLIQVYRPEKPDQEPSTKPMQLILVFCPKIAATEVLRKQFLEPLKKVMARTQPEFFSLYNDLESRNTVTRRPRNMYTKIFKRSQFRTQPILLRASWRQVHEDEADEVDAE